MKERAKNFPSSEELDFSKLTDKNGIKVLPANIFNSESGKILGTVFMNRESYELTLEFRELVAWSRDRAVLWRKGETSGNTMRVKRIELDCDADTINVLVRPSGPFCHRGTESCFEKGGQD